MIAPEPPFELTPTELASPLWTNLMAHFTKRLDKLRADNDSASLTETQTARIRGQIAELKTLIALSKPVNVLLPDDR